MGDIEPEAVPDIIQRALAILDEEARAWLGSRAVPGRPDEATLGSENSALPQGLPPR